MNNDGFVIVGGLIGAVISQLPKDMAGGVLLGMYAGVLIAGFALIAKGLRL